MKKMLSAGLLLVTLGTGLAEAQSQKNSPELYLGQNPPGSEPLVFAPDLISKADEYEFGSVFSKDASEFFYGVDIDGKTEIRTTHWDGDKWTEPEVLISHSAFSFNDPFLSPDESKLYFISNKSENQQSDPKDYDIWYINREEAGWSDPVNAGTPINTESHEYYISFTSGGDMYFASNRAAEPDRSFNFDIYKADFNTGQFINAVAADSGINSRMYEADVFVSPDESFLIFSSFRKTGLGEGDLYISFKKQDGSWSKAKNMGSVINTEGHELCPFVTKDGKYLFYTSNKDIYWVSADIIETLK
ncbi:hypothetical protein [Gracilimonas sp.]|uniref:hypothetical protein n=1 Tax=Gracilimonas sp. TaxID=1974203 RepID=UPI0032EC10C1